MRPPRAHRDRTPPARPWSARSARAALSGCQWSAPLPRPPAQDSVEAGADPLEGPPKGRAWRHSRRRQAGSFFIFSSSKLPQRRVVSNAGAATGSAQGCICFGWGREWQLRRARHPPPPPPAHLSHVHSRTLPTRVRSLAVPKQMQLQPRPDSAETFPCWDLIGRFRPPSQKTDGQN